jgi:hypothetical protein|tara:strand:- start:989 stop:1207 length:219 start_codon:yes stop_codon:yes gene_type:complete
MTRLIIVLADGETWMELDGSKVMEISEEAFEELSSSDYRPKWFGDEMFPNDPIKEAYVTDLLITPNSFKTKE